jgi:hypothetical protein
MNDEILGAVPGSYTASAFGRRVQDFQSKALSRLVRWVGEERVVDGG